MSLKLKSPKPLHPVTTRIDSEVLEFLEKVAEDEGRTTSNVIRNALKNWAEGRQNRNRAVAA